MNRHTLQHSPGHLISNEVSCSRRSFLKASALGTATFAINTSVLESLGNPIFAGELKKHQKRVILLWLAGGASQLETWDPKPGRPTGGPYSAISTAVPGIQISELLPKQAERIKKTAIIRSLNTKNGSHGGGAELMMLGRRKEQAFDLPDLGAIVAHELGQPDSPVPDYVSMYTATEGRRNGTSGFLGARYAPMFLTEKMVPPNIEKLDSITQGDHQARNELRNMLAKRFERGRSSSVMGSHNFAYQRVKGLMASDKLFDVSQESAKMHELYGPTQFGQQCLIARRLCEAGVPFIRVARAWWDSHGQNFETHRELCADLDHVMAGLIDDLEDRGLLEHTLIITLGEFGRTPRINASLGRDHFANAWSCSLTGCGIKGGSVYGKSDQDGNKVIEGEITAKHLFATIYQALGIDYEKAYQIGSRPVPITDFGGAPIKEVLL